MSLMLLAMVDAGMGYYHLFFFFQAEDGIRDAQESRGLGDVYKRQAWRRTRRMSPEEVRVLFRGLPSEADNEAGEVRVLSLIHI